MGILTSVITLGIVVGLGYYTIKYIIPKIESGEFDLGLGGLIPAASGGGGTGTNIGGEVSGTEGSADDVSAILGNLAKDVGLPTAGGELITPTDDIALPEPVTKPAAGGGKKGKGDYLKSDLAGADNRKAAGGKSGGSRGKKKGGGSSSKTSSGSKKSSKSKDEEEEAVEEIEKETIYFYYNNVWDY